MVRNRNSQIGAMYSSDDNRDIFKKCQTMKTVRQTQADSNGKTGKQSEQIANSSHNKAIISQEQDQYNTTIGSENKTWTNYANQ